MLFDLGTDRCKLILFLSQAMPTQYFRMAECCHHETSIMHSQFTSPDL